MSSSDILRSGATLAMVLMLAACSGSSGSGGSGSTGGTGGSGSGGGSSGGSGGSGGTGGSGGDVSVADLEARLLAFEAEGNAVVARPETVDMPSGSATYSGQMLVGIFDDAEELNVDLIGDLELVAGFSQGTINGSAGNFIGVDGRADIDDGLAVIDGDPYAVDGSLAMDGDIAGNTMTGRVTGTLSRADDGASATFDIGVEGGFFGEGAAGVAGSGDGDAVIDGQRLNADSLFYGTRD